MSDNLYSILAKRGLDTLLKYYEPKLRDEFSAIYWDFIAELNAKRRKERSFIKDVMVQYSVRQRHNTRSGEKLLNIISDKKKWGYRKYINLFCLIKKYGSAEIQDRCDKYASIYDANDMLNEIIMDYKHSLQCRIDSDDFQPVAWDFIKELWENLKKRYNIPALNAVFFSKSGGSLLLAWLFSADEGTVREIRESLIQNSKLPENITFLRGNNITHILLNYEKVYPVSFIPIIGIKYYILYIFQVIPKFTEQSGWSIATSIV